MSKAVLLLAYGGPDSLDDVPAYLSDIRSSRQTPQHLIDEIRERYRLIGGRSPLLTITQSAAARLQRVVGLPVYVGMRHWHPFISETVARMVADGVGELIAICMAPHFSALSIGAYRKRLDQALAQCTSRVAVDFVESWHTLPEYLDGVAGNVVSTLARFSPQERDNVIVVFTAHSLPESILQKGDPYDSQLRKTAQLLAERLGMSPQRWRFSYQSAAQVGVPWLGPPIEEVVPEIGRQGSKNVLIAPIGFIADHVEVLYDIDIEVQAIAAQHGIRVERTPMLNDSPALVTALAALVRAREGNHGSHD